MRPTKLQSLLSNSMFIRLMLSFLLIIIISSTFYLIAYNFFIHSIESEIVSNASYSIEYKAAKFDEKLNQIKNLLLNLTAEPAFSPVVTGQLTPYAQNQIVSAFADKYLISNEFILEYVQSIFVLPTDKHRNVLTMEATFKADRFFQAFYTNQRYAESFWLNEIGSIFTYKIYSTAVYLDYANYNYKEPIQKILLPLAFKREENSSFILIALVDAVPLYHSIDKTDNFYIFNTTGELIYPLSPNENFSSADIEPLTQYRKTKQGYLFTRYSQENGLIYSTFLSNAALRQQLQRTNLIFQIIAAASVLISIILSVYLVNIFNNPVKQIASIICQSSVSADNIKVVGLNFIRDNIKLIVEDNQTKNSMLDSFFYQLKLKGNYTPINSLNKHIIFNNYILICFVIHYKDKYLVEVQEESGKGTYILKELIEQCLSGSFADSITFQAEHNKIISIINVQQSLSDIQQALEKIAEKLKNEEEYVFFTIILSNICQDTSQLHKTYDKLFDLYKYRKLASSTQILSENLIKASNNRYYLPADQFQLLNNLLSDGKQQECQELVGEILLKNYKRDVTQYSIQLLCTEIVNCGINILSKLYGEIPAGFDVTGIYSQYSSFTTVDEFRQSCDRFIISVTDYVQSNHKESCYIVDYIQEYIEKHYSEDIYLDLLAKRLGITNNYISSCFREKVGTNFNYYLNNFRIQRALELLAVPALKIKDVSEKVGYSNVSSFIRIFKKHIGKTPDEYRRSVSSLPG